MNLLVFFMLSIILIVLLIIHSYFKRGLTLTFNFFLFAFMLTFTKGGVHVFKFVDLSTGFGTRIMLHTLISTTVWMLVFYLSWCSAERIVERSDHLKGKIFPTLFFSGLVVAALSYAIEATAVNVGWWGEPIINNNEILLIPFNIIRQWFYFSTYFLAAYFLIACSEYKKNDWKTAFFILPFIHTWIPQFFGQGLPQFIEETLSLTILSILALISPLRFDYSGIKLPAPKHFLRSKLLESLPMLVTFSLLFILAFLDVVRMHNFKLLISLLPMGFLILPAIKKIPLLWIILLNIICLLTLNKQAVPATIPIIFLILFLLISKSHITKISSLSK